MFATSVSVSSRPFARRGHAALILVIVLAALAALGALLFMGGEESGGAVQIGTEQEPEQEGGTGDGLGAVDLTDGGSGDARDERAELGAALANAGDESQADEKSARKGATVTGRVADSAGRPVVGATVRLERGEGGGLGAMAMRIGAPNGIGAGRTATTDARGLFEFENVRTGEQRLIASAPGFATREPERFDVEGLDPVDVGTLELELAIVLSGRVVDSLGRGVAGVELRSSPRVEMGGGMIVLNTIGAAGEPLTTTGPGGEFTIDTLPAGPWRIGTVHPEHPARTFEGEVARPGDVERDLLWELPDGAVIRGYVVGTDRREGPYRVLGSSGGMVDFGLLGGGNGGVDVGPDGAFELRGLEPDTDYDLRVVRAPDGKGDDVLSMVGLGDLTSALSETKSFPSGTLDARLEILAPGRVRLRVATGDDARPVEAFTAALGEPWALETLRDADGRTLRQHPGGIVEFDDVSTIEANPFFGGSTIVRIQSEGYVTLDVPLGERPDPGGVIDLGTVMLEQARRARITVLGPDGPVQGARVALARASDRGFELFEGGDSGATFTMSATVSSDGEEGATEDVVGPDRSARARTDADGLAEFDMPANDGKLRLTVEHRDFAPYAATLTVAPEAELVHTVELGPGGVVVVRVVDPAGAPVAGIGIQHRGPGVEGSALFDAPRTKADGTVRFDRLTPGDHGFRTRAGARGDGPGVVFDFPGTNGGGKPWSDITVEHGDVLEVLLTDAATATLVGQVRLDGEPLVGARVTARSNDSSGSNDGGSEALEFDFDMVAMTGRNSGRTDENGRYSIEGLEPGAYEVSVDHDDRALPAKRDALVVAGVENQLDVDLVQNGIRGRVVDEEGAPIPGVVVRAKRAGGEGSGRASRFAISLSTADGMSTMLGGPGGESVRTDANGAFELPGLPEDVDLRVVVEAAEGAPYSIGVESDVLRVGLGQWLEGVELEAPIGGAVDVAVSGELQKELVFVVVSADRLDDAGNPIDGSRTTGFADDGDCRLLGLESGRWRIGLRGLMQDDSGPPARTTDVEVRRGEATPIEF
ncbi:Nickel uptake substrate-specific transmembrane region [Planctomycetes bacterium Pla163]|uniref:Nickel uptake substrate-specific transmembrane region n=2 Tax=Rohdeia mirabilis TaxID=2528008 RepID=A0A518CZR0_9BACT|nr:Nickel uptake substrate-specific transmembrane region [Planctomycetes bacterium Pla163]